MPEGVPSSHTVPIQTVVRIGCEGCPAAGWCAIVAEGPQLRTVSQRPLLEQLNAAGIPYALSQESTEKRGNEGLALSYNNAEPCDMRCTREDNIVRMRRVGYAITKLLRACGVNYRHFVNM